MKDFLLTTSVGFAFILVFTLLVNMVTWAPIVPFTLVAVGSSWIFGFLILKIFGAFQEYKRDRERVF